MPRIATDRGAPWWTVISAAAAPVLLIGGWTLAAARQHPPGGYDSTVETISSLAALGAADRWLMTAALCGTGISHVITGYGLRAAARPGRVLLLVGGLSTVLVALFPLPRLGSSTAHTVSAALAFGALAAWPLFAGRRTAPLALSVAAGVVLLGLVGWFVVALTTGHHVGLAERVAAGAQSTWPLLAVLIVRRRRQPPVGRSVHRGDR